jgi:hypothetical protein|tara:strand:+ start:11600 stop:11884 length:285 start_codon:yes stop_codon:yes gene_type:complete
MTRKTKTFNVQALKDSINHSLVHGMDDQVEMRRGQCAALEFVLHESGNYSGFNYLDAKSMESSRFGTTVGVHEFNDAVGRWNFENTDDTRRYYY